ncbi:MAG: phosphohistidine phosphatase SixA [Terrimicrobiaceae bacterium]|nr:phosphohistidine phosphatase SixA [Terrimicrobiaceae bacterium]
MIVLFLRHAEAEGDAEDDFSRRLTGKGKDQADRVGEYCLKASLMPRRILASPVIRAKQTAERVAQRLGGCAVEAVEWLACGMAPETCFAKLSGLRKEEMVMLVGHEPDFSEVLAALLSCRNAEVFHLRKACLAGVDVRACRRGGGVLEFLVPARLMQV